MKREEFFAVAKVGSKVKLRDDLVDDNVYGVDSWMTEMGSGVVTISEIDDDVFFIEEEKDYEYAYTPEMVECIVSKVKFIEQENPNNKKIKICPRCNFTIPEACPKCGLNLGGEYNADKTKG